MLKRPLITAFVVVARLVTAGRGLAQTGDWRVVKDYTLFSVLRHDESGRYGTYLAERARRFEATRGPMPQYPGTAPGRPDGAGGVDPHDRSIQGGIHETRTHRFHFRTHAAGGSIQIGRASCRERVYTKV